MKTTKNNQTENPNGNLKKPWRTPVIRNLGNFPKVVLAGGGKLSPPAVDPGEPRKTRPSG
jgi:hypothetical protein